MDFFGSAPKITESEFNKACRNLRAKGLSEYDVEDIRVVFDERLKSAAHSLSRKDAERGIKWLRQNKTKHHLSDEQIDAVEEELKEGF